jgi:outer membrane murein-binding lipoprotein Lpp
MKKLIILSSLLLLGCNNQKLEELEVIDIQQIDSIFVLSDSLAKQAIFTLPKADKQFTTLVEKVETKIDKLEVDVKVAKREADVAKREAATVKAKVVYIRDTVYITEQKNFWGKKKVTVDGSEPILKDSVKLDSLQN